MHSGDRIRTEEGKFETVQSLEVKSERRIVYNLKIEGTQNYFVGKSKMLVHNGGECVPVLSSWRQALKLVISGDVRVATRADAEEIARAFAGYKNTTGEVRGEAELLAKMNKNPGYYHWADAVVEEDGIARVAGHTAKDG